MADNCGATSFSTLLTLRECPRRWTYSRARFEPGGCCGRWARCAAMEVAVMIPAFSAAGVIPPFVGDRHPSSASRHFTQKRERHNRRRMRVARAIPREPAASRLPGVLHDVELSHRVAIADQQIGSSIGHVCAAMPARSPRCRTPAASLTAGFSADAGSPSTDLCVPTSRRLRRGSRTCPAPTRPARARRPRRPTGSDRCRRTGPPRCHRSARAGPP